MEEFIELLGDDRPEIFSRFYSKYPKKSSTKQNYRATTLRKLQFIEPGSTRPRPMWDTGYWMEF